MIGITRDRIPGIPQSNYVGGKPSMIILHETANQSSTIDNEVAYVKRTWDDAFYHYLASWNKVVEVADPSYIAWGAGPAANPYAIHIELVRDNGKNFGDAYSNWLDTAVMLAKQYGIPCKFNSQQNGIVTHHWVSDNMGGTDHIDPDSWLAANGITLEKLEADLINKYGGAYDMNPGQVDEFISWSYNQIAAKAPTDAEFKFHRQQFSQQGDKWAVELVKGFKDDNVAWKKYKSQLDTANAALSLKPSQFEPVTETVYKKKA